jgi:hypothetical protein
VTENTMITKRYQLPLDDEDDADDDNNNEE